MAASKDAPAKFRPYLFHGVELDYDDNQAQGPCPFCQHDQAKFGVKASTGQFRCVRCEQSGNIYSFLKLLFDESFTRTTDKDYGVLSEDRGIPSESLKAFHFAKSMITGEWIIPGYNELKNVASLYRIVQEAVPVEANGFSQDPAHLGKPVRVPATMKTHKWVCMACPEVKQHPFGAHLISSSHTTVHVCEGVWDGPSLHSILPKEETPIGVPGAGVFLPEYMSHLNGRNVALWYDNDHPKKDKVTGKVRLIKNKPIRPGWDGQQRALTIIQESPKRPRSVSQCLWTAAPVSLPADGPRGKKGLLFPFVSENPQPLAGIIGYNPNLPDGFDVRDVIRALGQHSLAYLRQLQDPVRLQAIKTAKDEAGGSLIEPIPRTSFDELCKDWRDSLHFTQQLRSTLSVCLAVVISTELPTDPIWIRVIGPPGSGKSTIAEAISAAREYVLPKSVLRGFHSGYIGGDTAEERAKDASLIPALRNKTLILKDGDTLINSPARDKILSELRDIYDGNSRYHGLNRKNQDYEDIRTTFILCGTDTLRQLNRSSLGERFLDCEILGDEETSPYLDRAFGNTVSKLSSCMSAEADSTSSNHEAYNPEKELFLKRTTYGFIKYLKENFTKLPAPQFSNLAETQIKAMGQLLSFMRARVNREHGGSGELTHRPRVELGTRIVAQFVKLAFCSAIVLGKPRIDEEVLDIVRKVLLDSAEGFQYEITSLLMSNWGLEQAAKSQTGGTPSRLGNDNKSSQGAKGKLAKTGKAGSLAQKARDAAARLSPPSQTIAISGLSARQISVQLNLSETNVRRILADLQEFNIVKRGALANNSGQRGRDIHIWQPTEMMIALWELAHGRETPNLAAASNS